jgi:hypothetical protein
MGKRGEMLSEIGLGKKSLLAILESVYEVVCSSPYLPRCPVLLDTAHSSLL